MPWPCLVRQMSRHAACYRGNPLHHRWIGAHFCSGRESTSCRWATHGGATCSLEPSGPSIYHTNPPHTCPALTLHHAWPHLSRDRVWLCSACAGGGESGWRHSSRSTISRQPELKPGSARNHNCQFYGFVYEHLYDCSIYTKRCSIYTKRSLDAR